MYDHTFYKQVQNSRSDIRPHIKWAVSQVILHLVTSIFLRALCGYIWVNILTLSPRGDSEKGLLIYILISHQKPNQSLMWRWFKAVPGFISINVRLSPKSKWKEQRRGYITSDSRRRFRCTFSCSRRCWTTLTTSEWVLRSRYTQRQRTSVPPNNTSEYNHQQTHTHSLLVTISGLLVKTHRILTF